METLEQHLASRHFDTKLHTAWLNNAERCATFPLWNLSGQLVGYQRYRPDADKLANNAIEGRYFTRVKEGRVGVWGLESWQLSNILYITEGIFDAAVITSQRVSAIAVLSCDLSQATRRWLWMVRKQRPVIVVCDGDASGLKLAKYGHTYVQCPPGHDLGSMDQQDANRLLIDSALTLYKQSPILFGKHEEIHNGF